MSSTVLVFVFAVLAMLGVALAIIVAFLVSRRPAAQWQKHLIQQREHFAREAADMAEETIQPRQVSLGTMLEESGSDGSAYLEADLLPGYGRLEIASEKLEERLRR